MLFPFVLLSIAATAAVSCGLDLLWPTWLWAIPLMLIGFFAAEILLYALFLLIVSLFTGTNKEWTKRSGFHHFLLIYSIGVLLKLFRVKTSVEGEELIPRDQRWLLVSNHRSAFDPLAALWLLRRHELAFIAKPVIFKIPVAAQIMSREFFLAIDRENNREALKTILKAAEIVKSDISSMGIYPEGTRSRDGSMLPFKNGAFKIAQRSGAPVVVATIEGTENIVKRFPLRSTQVKLTVLHVFSAEEVKAENTAELSAQARQLMLDHLGK